MAKPQNPHPLLPALTLIFFSPFIAEVLSGATRLSFNFALVPEMMVWGCGVLLAREFVRSRNLAWINLLLLGIALSLAEEIIIQQTSIAPLPWLGSAKIYGRALGVNWLYLLFMLGYESVWVVLAPVHLTELLFPASAATPWLRRRGRFITALLFALGSSMAWFAWTKRARTVVFHAAPYHPPLLALFIGFTTIALLIALALTRPFPPPAPTPSSAPRPLVLALLTLTFGLPWYAVISLVFIQTPTLHHLPF